MHCPLKKPSNSPSDQSISLTSSKFQNNFQFKTLNTGNLFVDLAYSISSITSLVRSYITSLVSKSSEPNFQPNYFQIPFIYSVADNLINGNYKESSVNEKNVIVTTYKIPYKGEYKEEISTFITYFNTLTNILFYEIPREFSYNSLEQGSVALIKLSDGSFSGKIAIPTTFISSLFPQYPYLYLPFKIYTIQNNSILAEVVVSEPLVSEPLPPLCQGKYLGDTDSDPSYICNTCGLDEKWATLFDLGIQCAICPDGENIVDNNYIPTTLCTLPPLPWE
jgi:hypothetical protein